MTDRPDPSLLRTFFTPSSPLPLGRGNGPAVGSGLDVEAGVAVDLLDPAAVVRDDEGGRHRLGYDPEAVIERLVTERHHPRGRPLHAWFAGDSTWLPGWMRGRIRRAWYAPRLRRADVFPRWPVEPFVEELRRTVRETARRCGVAGDDEPFWPGGAAMTAVLSHDLDEAEIYREGGWKPFAEMEEAHGFRSSWHYCSSHLPLAGPVLEELRRRGHEVAWHGPRHDYRFAYRRPDRIRAILLEHGGELEAFGVRGFRSPFYLRTDGLYDGLSGTFAYDSSPHDTAVEFLSPYVREGCCTVFPFFRGGMTVLPITVPEDWIIACRTGEDEEAIVAVQREKLDWIRSVGGLAVILTHPVRSISRRPAAFGAYRRMLESLTRDPAVTVRLARDVAADWSRRARRAQG